MQGRFITHDRLTEPVVAAWRELSARAAVPNPFFDPDFLLPAWQHLPEFDGGLLAVFDESEMVASMPLVREARLRRLPLSGMVTAHGDYGFFGLPLIAPDRGPEVVSALFAAVRTEASWLRFDLLPADSDFAVQLQQVARAERLPLRILTTSERAVARASAPAPALSSGSLSRFARKRRALGRELGASVDTVDRSDDAGAVEDFLRLEASGWKGRSGGAFQVRPGHAEFLREMWNGFRRQGRLSIVSLQAGERAIATRCCLVGGDVLYAFKTSFDDELARFSTGTLLELELFDFLGDDVSMIDTCADPDNGWLNGLYPERRPMVQFLVGLTAAGRTAVAAQPLVDRAARLRERLRDRSAARETSEPG